MHDAYERAIKYTTSMPYARNLFKLHPLVRCERNQNTMMFMQLKTMGSPACTDGEKIYYSEEVTRDMFSRITLYSYNTEQAREAKNREEYWKVEPTENEIESIDEWNLAEELKVILLHEMNHAMFEHLKDEITYEKKSDKFKGKMRIAHEIQANDGFCGTDFAMRLTQQIKGVTNKRQYKTTIGFHKLKDIIANLPDDAGQDGQGQGKSQQQKMAEASGAYQRIKDKVEEEMKEGKGGNEFSKENKNGDELAQEVSEKVRQDNFKFGKNKLRGVIVSALSDRLRYDTDSERVMVSKSYKKIKVHTYSRPSKKTIVME